MVSVEDEDIAETVGFQRADLGRSSQSSDRDDAGVDAEADGVVGLDERERTGPARI